MGGAADPFARDPQRNPSLKVHARKAFNAETPMELIGDSWVTPTELFYCRHHHPVPDYDPSDDSWRLKVQGVGLERELTLTLDNLKYLFPKKEIVVTTQCGGNRRAGMNRVKKTMGISWWVGAFQPALSHGSFDWVSLSRQTNTRQPPPPVLTLGAGAPTPSASLTEIYLCHVCSDQKMLGQGRRGHLHGSLGRRDAAGRPPPGGPGGLRARHQGWRAARPLRGGGQALRRLDPHQQGNLQLRRRDAGVPSSEHQ
jgi:hypothetical protein